MRQGPGQTLDFDCRRAATGQQRQNRSELTLLRSNECESSRAEACSSAQRCPEANSVMTVGNGQSNVSPGLVSIHIQVCARAARTASNR